MAISKDHMSHRGLTAQFEHKLVSKSYRAIVHGRVADDHAFDHDHRHAVVDIVADPDVDPPPDGTYFVPIPDGVPCNIGWVWDGTTFVDPNPPPEVP